MHLYSAWMLWYLHEAFDRLPVITVILMKIMVDFSTILVQWRLQDAPGSLCYLHPLQSGQRLSNHLSNHQESASISFILYQVYQTKCPNFCASIDRMPRVLHTPKLHWCKLVCLGEEWYWIPFIIIIIIIWSCKFIFMWDVNSLRQIMCTHHSAWCWWTKQCTCTCMGM